jgi:hypothetical protein
MARLCSALSILIRSTFRIIFHNRMSRAVDLFSFGFALSALIVAIYFDGKWLNIIFVCFVDAIVVFWIFSTAVLSTPCEQGGLDLTAAAGMSDAATKDMLPALTKARTDLDSCLPTRPSAIIILPLFLAALIFAFAKIHLAISIEDVNGKAYSESIELGWDAQYFSFATIFPSNTVSPKSGSAKIAVICEFVNGLALLIAALPILVGRLSTYR